MSKYHSKKTIINGITFDSKKESKRYLELKELEKLGLIKHLELQPSFELIPTFKKNNKTFRKTSYKADFKYFDTRLNKYIIEDVKSPATSKDKVYCIKKKLFLYKYPQVEFNEQI